MHLHFLQMLKMPYTGACGKTRQQQNSIAYQPQTYDIVPDTLNQSNTKRIPQVPYRLAHNPTVHSIETARSQVCHWVKVRLQCRLKRVEPCLHQICLGPPVIYDKLQRWYRPVHWIHLVPSDQVPTLMQVYDVFVIVAVCCPVQAISDGQGVYIRVVTGGALELVQDLVTAQWTGCLNTQVWAWSHFWFTSWACE